MQAQGWLSAPLQPAPPMLWAQNSLDKALWCLPGLLLYQKRRRETVTGKRTGSSSRAQGASRSWETLSSVWTRASGAQQLWPQQCHGKEDVGRVHKKSSDQGLRPPQEPGWADVGCGSPG